jgi:hypothetical protein
MFKLTRNCVCLFSMLAFCFAACKKSNDNPLANVRLASVDVTNSSAAVTHYRLFYDKFGQIDSINISGNSNGYKKFAYSSLAYTISDQNYYTYKVTIDANNLVTEMFTTDTPTFIYNGTQLAELDNKILISSYPYFTKKSYYYTWANGDISSITTSGSTESYGYDNTKTGQPGDALRVNNILDYGRPIVKTAHVPDSLVINGVTYEKFFGKYDGSGRMTRLTMVLYNTNGSTDSTFYDYGY